MQFTNNLLGKNITFTGKQMASRNAVCNTWQVLW